MTYPFEHDPSIIKSLFVPISHLFILPAAYFAWKLKLYDVVIGVACVFFVSTTYHFVEARTFSIEDINTFWNGDYICIFLLGLIIELAMFRIKAKYRYYIVLPTVLVSIFLAKLFHDTSLLFVLLGMYFIEFLLIHKLHMAQKYGVGVFEIHIVNLIFYTVLLLIIADSIFFLYWAGNPGDRYYFWRHLAGWHIPIFISFSLLMGFEYLQIHSKAAIKKPKVETTLPITQPNVPTNLIVRSGLPESPTLVNRSISYPVYEPEYQGL